MSARVRPLFRALRRAPWLVLGVLALACTPDFTMPWEVKDPRPMAARVEVESDPTRSQPKPGESFRIRMYMATPRKPKKPFNERYDVRLELCLGVKLAGGALACGGSADGMEGSLIFQGKTEFLSDEEILFSGLSVPSQLSELPPPFNEIDRLALFGAVCVDGKVERVEGKRINEDPTTELFRCVDNADAEYKDPLIFNTSVLLDLGQVGDGNHHPSFACEGEPGSGDACRAGVEHEHEERVAGSFVLVRPQDKNDKAKPREALAWDPRADAADSTQVPWEDCANSGLPVVHLEDGKHLVRVRFDAQDRETYAYSYIHKNKPVMGEEREELEVAHALTDLGGEIERFFSILERDVPDDQAEVWFEYTPPGVKGEAGETLTAKGRLVRFYFVVRDERGGVDYTVRELCLLPKGK